MGRCCELEFERAIEKGSAFWLKYLQKHPTPAADKKIWRRLHLDMRAHDALNILVFKLHNLLKLVQYDVHLLFCDLKIAKKNAFLLDEFLAKNSSILTQQLFTDKSQRIDVHVHCFQKSLAQASTLVTALSIPRNYSVKLIDSGCCGMAGSFAYEEEHEEMSEKIANLSLIPHINKVKQEVLIVASGTSCRHQINDLSKREALHPVEILYDALT